MTKPMQMRATFMSTSDTTSGVQLVGRLERESPAFSGWMRLTKLVIIAILPILVHFNYVNYKNPETDDCTCRVRNIIHIYSKYLYLLNTSFSIT